MIFINILFFNFLSHLISCDENRECDFRDPESISTVVEKMANPSKDLLNKFGLDIDFSEGIGINLTDQGIDVNQYIYSAASFGIIFLVFFVLFLIYFFCFCITNCCCCCHAKDSQKPKCVLIFFHFLGIILLVITAIMIFLSSSSVIKAVDNFRSFPSNLNNEIDGIFDQLNSTISNTFDTVDRNVDNFIDVLNNFTNWLSTSSETNNESAYRVIPLISGYNDTFGDESKQYMKDYTDVLSYLKTSSFTDLNNNFLLMNSSRQPAIDTIINLSQTLVDAMASISETADNIKNTTNSTILEVKNQVDGFRNGEVNEQINDIKNSINGSSLDLSAIEEFGDTLYPLLKIVYYVIAAFILLIAILYSAIFFCHNCFSRCCSCCFPIWGLLLNILIILPGCIFAVLFILFNNLCPNLEDTISSFLNSDESDDGDYYKTLMYNSIFPNRGSYKFSLARSLDSESSDDIFKNLTEMLLCEHDTPILDLLDIGFDPDSIINDFRDDIDKSTGFTIPTDLTDKLTDFAENFNVEDNISSNYILYNHDSTLSSVIQDAPSQAERAKKMNDTIYDNEPSLKEVRDLMTGIIEFGSSIVPEAEDLNNQTSLLVDQLINEASGTLNNGLDSITCKSFRCVYSPFKNTFCVDLLAGLAFWVFSTILTIIGLAILSITVCRRRRSMATSKIQNTEESETSSSVEEFNKE